MKYRRLDFRSLLWAWPLSILLLSCIKEKNAADTLTENTNLLTSGTWRFTGYRFSSVTSNRSYSDLPACVQDDLYTFYTNGSGEINEGPSKCNASDPQSKPLSWRFLDDKGHRIELFSREFIVTRLDKNAFSISTPFTDPYAPSTSYDFTK